MATGENKAMTTNVTINDLDDLFCNCIWSSLFTVSLTTSENKLVNHASQILKSEKKNNEHKGNLGELKPGCCRRYHGSLDGNKPMPNCRTGYV